MLNISIYIFILNYFLFMKVFIVNVILGLIFFFRYLLFNMLCFYNLIEKIVFVIIYFFDIGDILFFLEI